MPAFTVELLLILAVNVIVCSFLIVCIKVSLSPLDRRRQYTCSRKILPQGMRIMMWITSAGKETDVEKGDSVEKTIQAQLFQLQDEKYRQFQCRLMPTVLPENVIGIRTPVLRRYAKNIAGTEEAEAFLKQLPHRYYEENNLHGFLLEMHRDYPQLIAELDLFLPYVDNWATCDEMSPKIFKKHTEELLTEIRRWMASERTYTIRFGIGMLMRFYLDEAFRPEYLEMVAEIVSEEYYVRMMAAWFFATALAKQYEQTVPYIEENRLELWTHNKTIQKSVESYRVSAEHKEYLRTLRRHEK